MERYDYHGAVKDDIWDWLKETQEGRIGPARKDEIYEELFDSDPVTGNASGSYTLSTWTAEENLCHNMGLLVEALDALGGDFRNGPEGNDVVIRCYLLGQCLDEVVDKWNEEHPGSGDEGGHPRK